ncbi:hypothetical protein [uncultured Clostridium sp.]|uniref:hypothetical protein n=1 Tax=uncultured Clostridium sp. TaxID=59620 RepID=UPI00321677D9
MKKIISILLCGIMIFCLVGCKNKDVEPTVKEQVIKQFEEGIDDYKTALKYFEENDNENQAKYSDLAFDKFNNVFDITKDSDAPIAEADNEDYIYYYEHYYSNLLAKMYIDNTSWHGAKVLANGTVTVEGWHSSYEAVADKWNENIDEMNKVIEEYKEQNNKKVSK